MRRINIIRLMGGLLIAVMALASCDEHEPKVPKETKMAFKVVNVSLGEDEKVYAESKGGASHSLSVNVTVGNETMSVIAKSGCDSLAVLKGNVVKVIFTPSCAEETEAKFTFPDGKELKATKEEPEVTWTVPVDVKEGWIIKGESSYETSSSTVTSSGTITLYTPDTKPVEDPSDNPGDDPSDNPNDDPGDDPSDNPNDNPGDDPGEDPGNTSGDDPSDNTGEDPGDNPNVNPGDDPGTETMSELEKALKGINQADVDRNVAHTDIVFAYVFNKELLDFLTPCINVTVDGSESISLPFNSSDIVSTKGGIDYKSLTISFGNKNLCVWWGGIQREGLSSSGTMKVTFKKKDVDYSKYSNDLELHSKPIVATGKVKANSNTINMTSYNSISITIGSQDKNLEKLVNKIAEGETVKFGD